MIAPVGDLATLLHIDAHAEMPLYRQISDQLVALIGSGTMAPGTRLPAIRQLASAMGISHITVSQAYDRARRQGLLELAPGRGARVALTATPQGQEMERRHEGGADSRPHSATETAVPVWPSFVRTPRTSLMHTLTSQGERGSPTPINLSSGQPDAALLPVARLQRHWAAALREAAPHELLYAGPEGDPQVRLALAAYCAGLGYAASPDEVLVTTGAQQGIDLVVRTFIQPGEHVLVEAPGYPSALDLLESHGCRLVPVPVDRDGLQVELLPALIDRFRPRLLYLAPTGQNPTGAVLSARRRSLLRALLKGAGLLVVEDDVCSEYLYDSSPLPGLRTAETRGMVITLKSFAKTVLPGLRVGCLLAAPGLLGPLAATKALTDRFTAPVAQHALRRYLQSRSVHADLTRARDAYRVRRDALVTALQYSMPRAARWTVPQGGLNLWLTVPDAGSAEDLRRLAAAQGVLYAPGAAFWPAPDPASSLRLTFADSPPELLKEGATRLGEALRQAAGQAARPGPVGRPSISV